VSASPPPAGWYPDPAGSSGSRRYWDGSAWTEQTVVSTVGRTTGPESLPQRSTEPLPQSGSSWTTYWGDLKQGARVLWASPALVVFSVALLLVPQAQAHRLRPTALWTLLGLAAELFLGGFVGTQRIWLVQKLRGGSLDLKDVWTVSWKFFWRFVRLGLLAAIALVPAIVIAVVTQSHHPNAPRGSVPLPTGFKVALVVGLLVIDVIGTFIVPALALTVTSVSDAIRVGWTMTKALWPTNAWYLLAPGITFSAVAGLLPQSVLPIGATIVIAAISAVLGLWFKATTVAFYLRSFPQTADYGSA
jgi:hypothetical protein